MIGLARPMRLVHEAHKHVLRQGFALHYQSKDWSKFEFTRSGPPCTRQCLASKKFTMHPLWGKIRLFTLQGGRQGQAREGMGALRKNGLIKFYSKQAIIISECGLQGRRRGCTSRMGHASPMMRKINYTQVAWPLENLHTALEYINKV